MHIINEELILFGMRGIIIRVYNHHATGDLWLTLNQGLIIYWHTVQLCYSDLYDRLTKGLSLKSILGGLVQCSLS